MKLTYFDQFVGTKYFRIRGPATWISCSFLIFLKHFVEPTLRDVILHSTYNLLTAVTSDTAKPCRQILFFYFFLRPRYSVP